MSLNPTETLPKPFGRYLLQKQLAAGGMGAVYLARLVGQQGFDKWVAVKTIHAHIATEADFLRMFAREARLCARIDHPNVCQVFDYGDEQGAPFLAMEFLKGEPVNLLLRHASRTRQPIPFAVAVRIIADAARGLHAAHELTLSDGRSAEVVHRDVSPQNLFVLYSGITKVVDFGVARCLETLSEQSRSGTIRGKLAYMSPEQANGEAVDRRTDVFALGVVLWEMLTTTRLFAGESDAHTLRRVLLEPIRSPRAVRDEVPESLAALTLWALARDVNQRPVSAEAFAWELERWLAREAMGAGVSEVARYMSVHFSSHAVEVEELLRTPIVALEREFAPLSPAPASLPSAQPGSDRTGETAHTAAAIPGRLALRDLAGAGSEPTLNAHVAAAHAQLAAPPRGASRSVLFVVLGVAALIFALGATIVAVGVRAGVLPSDAVEASPDPTALVAPSASSFLPSLVAPRASATATALSTAAPGPDPSVFPSASPSVVPSVAASASATAQGPSASHAHPSSGAHRRDPHAPTSSPSAPPNAPEHTSAPPSFRPMTDYEP